MVCACFAVFAVAKNIDKYGDAKGKDPRGAEITVKQIVTTKALTDIFLAFATVVVVVVGVLDRISQDLFVALLITALGGLGLKISYDLLPDRNVGKIEKDTEKTQNPNSSA